MAPSPLSSRDSIAGRPRVRWVNNVTSKTSAAHLRAIPAVCKALAFIAPQSLPAILVWGATVAFEESVCIMASHPLDPLNASEISTAAGACSKYAATKGLTNLRFNTISLQEPTKAELVKYGADPAGSCPPRLALVVLQTPPELTILEAVVDVATGKVESWTEPVAGGLPVATPDDCFEAEDICKADTAVQQMLRERYGITDLSLVRCDPWSTHAMSDASLRGKRVMQVFMYVAKYEDDNHYAHPLDMVPIVDINLKKVVCIETFLDSPKVNMEENNYHSKLQKEWRDDMKPINVLQPEGPSFTIDGQLIKWQKWQFRLGFNYKEGVVLHDVSFQDGGKLRPVLHRLSLVEMAVPYAEPRAPFVRKCAFDVGDYGLGFCTLPLTLGCDCLGHIKYFPATLNNSKGEPVTIDNAICMHEEDAGLLWKHVEFRNNHNETRRNRRLVISHVATVVNYEYAFYWNLYLDGTISLEIKLTGELSTNVLSEGETMPEYGVLVGPGVNAQHHQHMFCVRIDPAIDDEAGGKEVVVSEVNVKPLPAGLDNSFVNAFVAEETDLLSVSEAQRDINPQTGRIWKFKNPKVVNPVTHTPVAYKLMPYAHPPLMASPDSLIAQKGKFASHSLWVTPYHPQQKYPAGDYVLSATECHGLAKWTQEDAPLEGADPVVWYSFGITHVVRVEDFPVMPCETVGFMLKPYNFFTKNPTLDVPGKSNPTSTLCNGTTNGLTNGCH